MNEEKQALDNQIELGDEKSDAIAHKEASIKRLDKSFIKHIELQEYKKTHLLAYWINDFSEYHDKEKTFHSSSLRTFKRGNIIKVNLGFNIGNELGGLHYCVVLNKHDNPQSGTLNVIPLSSLKEDKEYNKFTCIDLGDELYNLLIKKFHKEMVIANKDLETMLKKPDINISLNLTKRIEYLKKIEKEISKMKHGSYALIHQITTISKQRIFITPILSGIKLSANNLDLIDEKIKQLYTHL